MANLIRLCNGLNNLTVKSVMNWKLCSNSLEVRCRFNNRLPHFTRRNVISNSKKPLSLYKKIGIGITTCIAIKVAGNNTVFCLNESNVGTELDVLNKKPNFNWRKFWLYLWPYWLETLGAFVAALICALLNIQIPVSLGHLVDVLSKVTLSGEAVFNELQKPALKILSYYCLQSLFTFAYITLLAYVAEGMAKAIKQDLFFSIMDQDITFFDSTRTGEIINRLTVDIHDFKSAFKIMSSHGLRSTTQVVGCSLSLFFISPTMTVVMMTTIPTVILIGTIFGYFLRKISFEAKIQTARVTFVAEEAVSNMRTVRAFAMEELENKILSDEAELCRILNTKLGFGIGIFQAGTHLFLNGIILGTIYVGGYMMSKGNLTAGELTAFLAAVQLLQKSLSQISLLFGLYIKGTHAGARVFEMIDLPVGKTVKGGKTIPYHSLIPTVEFKDVTFSYPSRPDSHILKKFNLTIPAGKTVAIVGTSGGGKSTLALLLERFYDISEGSILIDGEDIRNLDPKWLRRNVVGFINQEPALFATTIMENIRFGKPDATDAEVIKAAKLANADGFINKFDNGYQTLVGERGVAMSGGQKQRIALARALIKNPSVLILDEATSALDAESERMLQMLLEDVIKSRTTIIIAHRLSTIKNADVIVVLSNGVIVESGTHKELLAKDGFYASLVAQQLNDENK